ncbi:prepilin-type N-terminal cleavage/methylation domain-containing protein [Eubacterium limosum]|uniref:Prepilin-type N-terminal cleavage/methylation domain-containing protein n=1 Tax=Eubacterium limosum TaxID=1736 RepID=A0ABT5UT04_EUBLI|nr:prepilin-type N-terminal cleavage/methylation domain-containing protein [Eubacterium limosum]MCB6570264.1 prepilin-type N-terminal cleavage/methylation domain-containing protein [Eubacterium limosum]MDE1471474.1 prepilin-type N-terminal cleavage/methylation domain-containing protein [Eubacterium limosum]
MSDTRGFSLIEAVVAIAVLGVGIVSVFTIYHTVIIGQKVSEEILEQSLNINGIVNEIRTGIPAGRTEQAFEQEIAAIVTKHPGWQVEVRPPTRPTGLYELQLSYEAAGRKKKVFYAKVVYP